MDNYMIGFFILLVFIFTSRFINDKANKKLSDEKKVELINLFSKSKTGSFVILSVIIIIYFLVLKFELFDIFLSLLVYMTVLLIFIGYNAKKTFDKLKSNDFPDSYIKYYLVSTTLKFIGILIFVGFVTM